MAMNFKDALSVKVNDIEKPPLLPSGTYEAIIKKVPTMEETADKKWEMLDFPCQIVAATDEVSVDELAAYGGLDARSQLRRRFMFNTEDDNAFKRTLFDVKRFCLEHLMVEGDDNTDLKQLLDGSVGKRFYAFVKHNPDKRDPEVIYAEISKTAPIV